MLTVSLSIIYKIDKTMLHAYLSYGCYGATTKTKHECTIIKNLLCFYIMDSALRYNRSAQPVNQLYTRKHVISARCMRNSIQKFKRILLPVVRLWFQRNNWNMENKTHTAFLFYMYRKINIDHHVQINGWKWKCVI